MTNTLQCIWFKRDLRTVDHAPLAAAIERGPILPVFIYEPEVLAQAEWDGSHLKFLNECLEALDHRLRALGAPLICLRGEAVEVLSQLRRISSFCTLWAHEETGTWVTYQRDRRVRRWAKDNGVEFIEIPQTGVVRRLKSRNGWNAIWHQRMASPQALVSHPATPGPTIESVGLLTAAELGIPDTTKLIPAGGEAAAERTLEDFLNHRGVSYARGLSSPGTAPEACSRLSPYLAFGCISMRRVWQAAEHRRTKLHLEEPTERKRWAASLRAFQSRLHWHCHFMQKLEDEPRMEFENLQRSCDGLRENEWNEERFQAWCTGHTGYPMVDACMRNLLATRWINFRMRAMLVSFASYDLWLHWRKTAVYLARHFLDFEPGIHFSQFQMQSGTTGINTLRMYNPTKQAMDHDPTGSYIREWIPELRDVPLPRLFEPWKLTSMEQVEYGVKLGATYPLPIVDHTQAVREARQKIALIRRSSNARSEAAVIVKKHGSRADPRRSMIQDPVRKQLEVTDHSMVQTDFIDLPE